MGTIDFTNVILAVLTLIGGCGWIVNRRKYRQEVRSLQADNRQKDMDLSKDYVTEWRTYIAEPTNEASVEPSLLELCLARRRKTKSTLAARGERTAAGGGRAAVCDTAD